MLRQKHNSINNSIRKISKSDKKHSRTFKNNEWRLFLIILFIVTIGYIGIWFTGIIFQWKWASWTGFGSYIDITGEYHNGVTFWEIIQILLIPIILAISAYLLSDNQKKTDLEVASLEREKDRAIARDRSEDEILQHYFQQMGEFVFNRHLLHSNRTDEARALALATTRMVLRAVNGDRKGMIINYLASSYLISALDNGPIIILENTDLSGINLDDAWMLGTDLGGTNLSCSSINRVVFKGSSINGCDLNNSSLQRCNFQKAIMNGNNMQYTDLSGSFMEEANLTLSTLCYADLTDVKLDNSILVGVDFTGAKISIEQINKAKEKDGLIYPDGTTYKD